MARGGFRLNAGRKKLPPELRGKTRRFYLNEEQYQKVKEFVKCLKEKQN